MQPYFLGCWSAAAVAFWLVLCVLLHGWGAFWGLTVRYYMADTIFSVFWEHCYCFLHGWFRLGSRSSEGPFWFKKEKFFYAQKKSKLVWKGFYTVKFKPLGTILWNLWEARKAGTWTKLTTVKVVGKENSKLRYRKQSE